ncbi:GtrA family protein [uncultured Parabacteroides sp.]|uniref:GtrA family protein n=1 Tax=uncultured Parabacteroides sp. TaxID=512312 RepID=UPI0025EC8281|nr:GtrA family protein [uncultured Parabacteroides sp.]
MIKELLNRLFVYKTDNLLIQLIRYTIVGGLAFIVDFGLLFILTEYLGLHYIVSATCSFLAGLLVNYYISTAWVFESTIKSKQIEFTFFALIGVVGLGLNNLLIWIFTEKCHIYYMFSKLITAVLVYLWNFLGRKYLVFNKQS